MICYDGLIKKLRSVGALQFKRDNVLGQATYYGLLNGKSSLTLKSLDKLCKYFNCDIADLIEYVPDDE